jgi:hypothetical protein
VWEEQLRAARVAEDRPDIFEFIMRGLTDGFVIEGDFSSLEKTACNLPTTDDEKVLITEWLLKLLQKGKMYGPFMRGRVPAELFAGDIHRSPLGGIWRGSKYRPFVHFSYPRWGESVNTATADEWCTVKYIRFKEMVRLVASLGKGAWVWIADAADAFLQLRVQTKQHHLLGVEWQKRTLVFAVMMWGLACAPRMYTMFADGVEEIIRHTDYALFNDGALRRLAHYLDDFFGGHQSAEKAMRQFEHVLSVFITLNIPFKYEKISAPSQAQKVLGWIFDTRAQQLRVPQSKGDQMQADIERIMRILRRKRGKPTRTQLRSIAGKLRWASAAIFGGQAFVRRLERAGTGKGHEHVRVKAEVRADLEFWQSVLPRLCTIGVPFSHILNAPDSGTIKVCCDAAGNAPLGFGGASTTGAYFSVPWHAIWPGITKIDIFLGEMLAIAVVVLLNGHTWTGHSVSLFTDNTPVEWALRSKCTTSTRRDMMAIMRGIVLHAHRHQFYFWANRITTDENVIADGLSRMVWPDCSKQDPRFGVYPLNKRMPDAAIIQCVRQLTAKHQQYIHKKRH